MKDMGSINYTPYSRFNGNSMILRDELALDRTLLANERTLLSYLRSALALLIAGVSILHLAPPAGWFRIVGFVCLPMGILAGVVGSVRFWRMQRSISILRSAPAAGAAITSTAPADQ
jgi:putative membrane protein